MANETQKHYDRIFKITKERFSTLIKRIEDGEFDSYNPKSLQAIRKTIERDCRAINTDHTKYLQIDATNDNEHYKQLGVLRPRLLDGLQIMIDVRLGKKPETESTFAKKVNDEIKYLKRQKKSKQERKLEAKFSEISDKASHDFETNYRDNLRIIPLSALSNRRHCLMETLDELDQINNDYLKILYGEEDISKIPEKDSHPNYNKARSLLYETQVIIENEIKSRKKN